MAKAKSDDKPKKVPRYLKELERTGQKVMAMAVRGPKPQKKNSKR